MADGGVDEESNGLEIEYWGAAGGTVNDLKITLRCSLPRVLYIVTCQRKYQKKTDAMSSSCNRYID